MAIYSFPYHATLNCTKLILGTMPGRLSLKRKQYYAHGGNSFWKVMSKLLGGNITDPYVERIARLNNNGFALWDVLQHCERESSSDMDIENEVPNDFSKFFRDFPKVQTIIFNGGPAYDFYRDYVGFEESKKYIQLPSTSPQNNRWYTIDEMAEEWSIIL